MRATTASGRRKDALVGALLSLAVAGCGRLNYGASPEVGPEIGLDVGLEGTADASMVDAGLDGPPDAIALDAGSDAAGDDARVTDTGRPVLDAGDDASTDAPPSCAAGEHPLGGVCVANGGVRPILPMSLGDTSLRRPTLRFALPAGADGAVIELCMDRPCTTVIETLRVAGASTQPTVALPASSVVFWRGRARVGAIEDTVSNVGPTWLFHTPAVDNSGGVDTSYAPHLDTNGDGYDDIVIAAPFADPSGRLSGGSVALFLGSPAGPSASPAWRALGDVGDRIGYALAGAGDVDGDGLGDLLVGAPFDSPGGRLEAGSVSVFHGTSFGLSGLSPSVLFGDAAGDRFGSSVACAGDVDGDGYADVIVGAPLASPGGMMGAGTTSVFHGSAAGTSMIARLVIDGSGASEEAGHALAGAGDVNGDGFADVMIGTGPSTPVDLVRVFHGGSSGLGPMPARVLAGIGQFGTSVAGAGDVNGDGFADVVIGSRDAAPGGRSGAGAASIFYGSAAGVSALGAVALEGVLAGDVFGWSVSSAGDVNADGFGDVAIGAPQAGGFMHTGTVSVFHGSSGGVGMVPSQVLGGTAAGDRLGWAVARAGDVDRDGFADVIAGAYSATRGGLSLSGAASVFRGSASGVSATPAASYAGEAAGDELGFSVACADRETGGSRRRG